MIKSTPPRATNCNNSKPTLRLDCPPSPLSLHRSQLTAHPGRARTEKTRTTRTVVGCFREANWVGVEQRAPVLSVGGERGTRNTTNMKRNRETPQSYQNTTHN